MEYKRAEAPSIFTTCLKYKEECSWHRDWKYFPTFSGAGSCGRLKDVQGMTWCSLPCKNNSSQLKEWGQRWQTPSHLNWKLVRVLTFRVGNKTRCSILVREMEGKKGRFVMLKHVEELSLNVPPPLGLPGPSLWWHTHPCSHSTSQRAPELVG